MPEVSRPLDNDVFSTMSFEIHRHFTKGAGTPHGKIKFIRDVLSNMATVNFEGGYKEGRARGRLDQQEGREDPKAPQGATQAVPVPAGLEDGPDVAFTIRDVNGASVVRVLLNGQVLLRGQAVTDGNTLVHALSQIGRQMEAASRSAGGVG